MSGVRSKQKNILRTLNREIVVAMVTEQQEVARYIDDDLARLIIDMDRENERLRSDNKCLRRQVYCLKSVLASCIEMDRVKRRPRTHNAPCASNETTGDYTARER